MKSAIFLTVIANQVFDMTKFNYGSKMEAYGETDYSLCSFDSDKDFEKFAALCNEEENCGYVPKNNDDLLNRHYIFSTTATDLLSAIAEGKLDAKELAIRELRSRGLDNTGFFIGFKTK